jgi:hypothetical protein
MAAEGILLRVSRSGMAKEVFLMELEKKVSAPYVPWQTFLTALDHVKAIGGVPNEIDYSVFPSLNHQAKSQVLSAFKFLDLIDDDGKPKGDTLSRLALKSDERQAVMHSIIEKQYPDIVALDFQKITPTALDNALGNSRYNISGDTKKKAKTFLLKAAQFAGFTVSPLLTKITRNRRREGGRREGGRRAAGAGSPAAAIPNNNEGTVAPVETPRRDEPQGSQRTIQLRRGGSLTLLLDINILALKGDDRAFVFDLIDKIDAYEEGSTSSTEETSKVEKEAGE